MARVEGGRRRRRRWRWLPTMETPGILKYRVGSETIHPAGADHRRRPLERARTGDFAEFLFDEQGQPDHSRRSRYPSGSGADVAGRRPI